MTAKEKCAHAVHIETPAEIPELFYELGTVGIAAGASTPDDIIDEVANDLRSRAKCELAQHFEGVSVEPLRNRSHVRA